MSVDVLYQIFVGQRWNGSWQLLVVTGLGDCGERRVVGQVGSCHRQGPWAAIKRGGPSPRSVGGGDRRLTQELLDEIREFTEEEHRWMSVRTAAFRFTLSRTCSRKAIRCVRLRPLVIRTVPHLEDRHIRDRRKFAEEMLARLALGSGRRIARKIATSRPLDLDVTCSSDETIFRVDAVAPGHVFYIFSGKIGPTYKCDLLFFGIQTMRKRGGRVVTSAQLEPLFVTHPSQVGCT